MKRINFGKLLVLLIGFYAVHLFACDPPQSNAFSALKSDGGFVVFNNVPLLDENNKDVGDIAIEMDFFSCDGGIKKYIANLPFLAATGTVKAAFFENSNSSPDPKLFVIHGVEISSDTGVNYRGDYYTVHVYSRASGGYVRDERLSNYFGTGGDIVSDEDDSVFVYKFPYKTAGEIIAKIKSEAYKRWASGSIVKLTINKKTSIYSSANLVDSTKMYLVKGDSVLQETVEAGWISIMYKTPKGKEIRGWVQCTNTDGC